MSKRSYDEAIATTDDAARRRLYAFVEREIPILIDRYRAEREQGKEDPGS